MNTLDRNVPLPDAPKEKKMTNKTLQEERNRVPAHATRAFDTWTDESVHSLEATPWVRATSLEAPKARPGMDQRWIRTGSHGVDDPTNTARKFREGWKPRLAETVPNGFQVPTIAHGTYAGCIGVEGMLLCERPQKLTDKRNAYYREHTERVTNGMEAELQAQSNTAMPITQERTSKVVREVKVQGDEE